MSRRVLRLVERRTRAVHLPRADADYLLAHAAGVIDVQPGFAPRSYRLTPRGYVGFLDGPGVRFEISPKFPWPNLLMLLGLGHGVAHAGEPVSVAGGLLGVLARELADRIRAVAQTGLVRSYYEEDGESPFLRGRLRAAEQLRDAAARAFPDTFHVTETVFDLDTPWNRIPKAVASDLLARPDVPAPIRAELAASLAPLESVPLRPVADADFDVSAREPRAAAYNELLSLCRLIHDGFAAADLTAAGGTAFLLDLGRVFENYLARTVADAFTRRPGWEVEVQPRFELGATRGEPVVLQPDLLIRRRGMPGAVLDAKWKAPKPDPADLHQVLAYATVTGARHVGLVYPGRRFARRDLLTDGGRVRVSLFRVQVVGPADACRGSVSRLARSLSRAVKPA